DYEGVGLYFSSSSCLDASGYTGFKCDFAGSLGGCHLQAAINFSGDVQTVNDPGRGACAGSGSQCYPPEADVTTAALAATADAPTVKVPFSALAGGMPQSTADARHLLDVQWQLTAPVGGDAGGCMADFTVENVSFY
ncbi:MAG TPA: hypothetical protein VHO06_25335, partial [Polyangia bacterium]|nr:hypothetical protein [Polyangia bacterium]